MAEEGGIGDLMEVGKKYFKILEAEKWIVYLRLQKSPYALQANISYKSLSSKVESMFDAYSSS